MSSYNILPAPVSFQTRPSGLSGYWSVVPNFVDPSLATNWLYSITASSALSQPSSYSNSYPGHNSDTYTEPGPQSTSYKPTYFRTVIPPSVTNSTRTTSTTQSSATSKTFEGILQIQPVKSAETVSTFNRDDYDLPPIGPPVRKRLLKKSQPVSIPTAAISAPSDARSRRKTHTSRYRWLMTPHERSVRDRAEDQYYAAVNEMRYNVVKTALECAVADPSRRRSIVSTGHNRHIQPMRTFQERSRSACLSSR